MASLNGAYDQDAELPGDFEVIPAGKYPLQLIESDIKPTKNGQGKLFTYKTEIVDGEQKGRFIFGQLNLQNPNPTATKIGQSEFAAIRLVTDTPNPEDTADLHFKAFEAVVKIEPAKGEYKARNAIDWAKTAKLFQGEEVTVPTAANDNAAPANDNKPKPAAAPKKAAWPRKAA